MSKKQFFVNYPDGSRDRISAAKRDELLLSLQIVAMPAQLNYRYVGEVKTFHSMKDLSSLLSRFKTPELLRHYLDGSWTFELKGKRSREREETPDALAARCVEMGAIDAAVRYV